MRNMRFNWKNSLNDDIRYSTYTDTHPWISWFVLMSDLFPKTIQEVFKDNLVIFKDLFSQKHMKHKLKLNVHDPIKNKIPLHNIIV